MNDFSISGYGNIYPRTLEGKLTTIIYAIIGMPLFLLYLSNIGDVMARSFKWIYANVCLCRWCPGVARRRAERKRKRAQQIGYEDGEEESESSQNSWHVSRLRKLSLSSNLVCYKHQLCFFFRHHNFALFYEPAAKFIPSARYAFFFLFPRE